MKHLVLFSILLLTACATTRQVSKEVQAAIEECLKDRTFRIGFNNSSDNISTINSPYISPDVAGDLRVREDTLHLVFSHPVFDISEKFEMHGYKRTLTKWGETEITFNIDRPEKMCYNKKYKGRPVAFRLLIRSPQKVDVSIDGDEYKGWLAHFNSRGEEIKRDEKMRMDENPANWGRFAPAIPTEKAKKKGQE